MKSSFDVLHRNTVIEQSTILEASAGTGKTFSIENIVLRLLCGSKKLPIEKILIVTFTRAAVRELKARIHRALEDIQHTEVLPDYLLAMSDEEQSQAKEFFSQALLDFNEAQIFTIHAFCFRMLQDYRFEGDIPFSFHDGEVSRERLLQVVKDFFRTGLSEEDYHTSQLQVILKHFDGKVERLSDALIKVIVKGQRIIPGPSYSETQKLLKQYCQMPFDEEDVYILCPHFKGLCDRSGNIKADISQEIAAFSRLFTQDIPDLVAINFLEKICPENRTQRSLKGKHFPEEAFLRISKVQEKILPILQKALSPMSIFSTMAADCQRMLQQETKECMSPDQVLIQMAKCLHHQEFTQLIRERFQAVLIDEFQDTDPVQWEVFSTLFAHQKNCYLYLVGDPKQSIYAFRSADIYTYLKAASQLEGAQYAHLNTNYRSQKSLIDALNTLFSAAEDFIYLPKLKRSLPYQKVLAPAGAISDGQVPLQFFLAEGKLSRERSWPPKSMERQYFFPFIAEEILRLKKEEGIHYTQHAVLVRDRFQADSLFSFLQQYQIPAVCKRQTHLADSIALQAIKELLQAIMNPRQHSLIAVALGGPLIAWNHWQVRELKDENIHEQVLERFSVLKQCLFEQGYTQCFQLFLTMCWHHDSLSVSERLLQGGSSLEFYAELEQVAECLCKYQCQNHCSPELLLQYIYDIQERLCADSEQAIRHYPNEDAVTIMTLHMSKGLEFEYVYALGLINRTRMHQELIPCTVNGEDVLKACPVDSVEYQVHAEELEAEKMRQLYVAMTRAKRRLYVPVLIETGLSPVQTGQASPIELFLKNICLQELCDNTLMSIIHLNDKQFDLRPPELKASPELFPPLAVQLPNIYGYMHSFSSLAKIKYSSSVPAPHDFTVEEKNTQNLPSSHETGVFLHTLLQHYPTDPTIIETRIKGTPFEPWESVVKELVTNAYTSVLHHGALCFCLNDIPISSMKHEMEFLYSDEQDLFKGFIDLFFQHNGLYYLLDWKTNWAEDYSPQSIQAIMEAHDYFLQIKLYTKALKRYLKLVDERPFELWFGGVYYLFIRGLPDDGIYFEPFCKEDLSNV